MEAANASPPNGDASVTVSVCRPSEGGASVQSGSITRRPSYQNIATSTIRAEVLRGTPLSRTLRRWGSLWRTSPIDLSQENRQKLWELSTPCTELDLFLSHTWSTPGWQKYIALLTFFHWRFAAVAGLFLMVLFAAVDLAGLLPTMPVEGGSISPWAFLPPIFSVVLIFVGPKRGHMAFLDATCINQVDLDIQAHGIYSLAGFLAHSKELLILWTPPYFSRMWCSFEVAMYMALRKNPIVTWCPPFRQLLLFTIHIAYIFSATLDLIAATGPNAGDDKAMLTRPLLLYICAGSAICIVRPKFFEMNKLAQQMMDFDIGKAGCREEHDRIHVLQSVVHYYGDADTFNENIRGPLKRKMLAQAWEVSYLQHMSTIWPRMCYGTVWIVAQRRAGMPMVQWLCYAAANTATYTCLTPCLHKLLFWELRLFAQPRSSYLRALALNAFITVSSVSWALVWEAFFRLDVIDHDMVSHGPAVTVPFALGSLLVTCLLYRSDCRTRRGVVETLDSPCKKGKAGSPGAGGEGAAGSAGA